LKLHGRHLDGQNKKLLARITEVVADHPALRAKVALLVEGQGIGAPSPPRPCLRPCPNSACSPKMKSPPWRAWLRSIRGGGLEVRRASYMAVLTASRFNPILKAVYQRLRTAGKAHNVALVAVMRKPLVYLNSIL
jgi:hypothetical protein